jgi:hypothetical protein
MTVAVRRRRAAPWLAGVIAGAIAAASLLVFLAIPRGEHRSLATLSLTEVALPGLTIALPEGDTIDRRDDRYDRGVIRLEKVGGIADVDVFWSPGELRDADVPQLLAMFARDLGVDPADIRTAATTPHRTYAVDHPDHHVAITMVGCGARVVTVTTGARRDEVAALHRRIVASIACAPDAQRDAALRETFRD